jgi:hypothetical protein
MRKTRTALNLAGRKQPTHNDFIQDVYVYTPDPHVDVIIAFPDSPFFSHLSLVIQLATAASIARKHLEALSSLIRALYCSGNGTKSSECEDNRQD